MGDPLLHRAGRQLQSVTDLLQDRRKPFAGRSRFIETIDQALILSQLSIVLAAGVARRRSHHGRTNGLGQVAIGVLDLVGRRDLLLLPFDQGCFPLVFVELGELLSKLRHRLVQILQTDACLVGVVAQQQKAGSRRAGQQGKPHRPTQDAEQACTDGAQTGLCSCYRSGCGRLALSRLGQLDGHLRLYRSAARRSSLTSGKDGGGLGLALIGESRLHHGLSLGDTSRPVSQRSLHGQPGLSHVVGQGCNAHAAHGHGH
ncbi:hypothetical protein D3C78_1008120 [compost metagenome]